MEYEQTLNSKRSGQLYLEERPAQFAGPLLPLCATD